MMAFTIFYCKKLPFTFLTFKIGFYLTKQLPKNIMAFHYKYCTFSKLS